MKTACMTIAIASALLTSCKTVPDADAPDASARTTYKAAGTEPFWSLKINDGAMVFERAGEKAVTADGFVARPSFNGWRYVSKTITADVTFSACSDGMSDWIYKDTVTVMVGDQEYKGCGGGIVPPESLERTAWRVVSINGAEIPADRGALVAFGDGRMSGTVGCNRLGAAYAFADRNVSFGPVMSTKMACADPVGKQEYTFVTVLGALASTEFPGDGSMVLTGKDGGKIVLMQSI
jgi:heat shock protein HslJ